LTLTTATLIGTVLQVGMVVSGHTNPAVKNLFAVGGMTISLVAGVAYVLLAPRGTDSSPTLGGTLAGALCALIGIGDEVEPVAVANPVERQAMGKVAHDKFPLSKASSEALASRSSNRFNSSPEKVAALSAAGGSSR
jgi:hypothetical protein